MRWPARPTKARTAVSSAPLPSSACRPAFAATMGRRLVAPAWRGLSRLCVWLMRLGIVPERIAVGHPEENSAHEQFHAVLKKATARPPPAHLGAQHRPVPVLSTGVQRQR